ncbi:uncharacterized protein LOC101203219 isoform X1 [Cucumis sativus]|uniref:uncharacterized protein LOC101203219 isoform X1 n=1 Tax=Cucumis sativus TaxID=3659 RepID=UPI0005EC9F13|nr:uncharacterized protein LOC101203219 isoform X1 [Cucumis sativus]XP_011650225.1 uncharacterized protein LOC101203219 isoform X1 [Cucumis sativus]
MDISACDTNEGLEHKMKKRKQEQFDDASEGNNTGSVCSGFEFASSMDKILFEKDPSPDATLVMCSKLESETGKNLPEICNLKGNVHEKEHNDDEKLSKDTDTENENINGSYNLILNAAEVKQNVAGYSVEMEEPSSMNAYKEDSGISEDPGGLRGHEVSDQGNIDTVAQELSKEMIDVKKDVHSREKLSDPDYPLPCNELEYDGDGSLKSLDVEQINDTFGNNASEKIVEGPVEEASVCCSFGEHDDEASTIKELIMSTPSCVPPGLENAETAKEEVVCFTDSGETSSVVNAMAEEETPPLVLDTSEKGDSIGSTTKKLLVLDVNGLLADFICYVPPGYKPDIIIRQKAVFKRPFCDDFIKFCFERFEVGVWSSRTRRNVDMVIDFLMRDYREKLLFCWDQSHCTDTTFSTVENKHKPLVLKEIKKLWKYLKPREFNASNTLLLDDSPHKALCNPDREAIFGFFWKVYPWQKTFKNTLSRIGLANVPLQKRTRLGSFIDGSYILLSEKMIRRITILSNGTEKVNLRGIFMHLFGISSCMNGNSVTC